MAVTGLRKYFGSDDGYFNIAASWRWISIRSPEYTWTQSGADSNAYYLKRADGTIPDGLISATFLSELALRGTLLPSSAWPLAAGTWKTDDKDSLGKDTIYVRLPDTESSPDPDNLLLDALTYRAVPQSVDAVIFDDASGSLTGDFTQAMYCAELTTTASYRGKLGKDGNPLVIWGANSLMLDGGGEFYIAFADGQSINPEVHIGTQSRQGPTVFLRSNYANTVVRIRGGQLFMPDRLDATSLLNRLEIWGEDADVVLDRGVQMTANDSLIIVEAGRATFRHTFSPPNGNIQIYGGRVDFQEPFTLTGTDNGISVLGGTVSVRTTKYIRKIALYSLRQTGRLPLLDMATGVDVNVGTVELWEGTVRTDSFNGGAPTITLNGMQEIQVRKL